MISFRDLLISQVGDINRSVASIPELREIPDEVVIAMNRFPVEREGRCNSCTKVHIMSNAHVEPSIIWCTD